MRLLLLNALIFIFSQNAAAQAKFNMNYANLPSELVEEMKKEKVYKQTASSAEVNEIQTWIAAHMSFDSLETVELNEGKNEVGFQFKLSQKIKNISVTGHQLIDASDVLAQAPIREGAEYHTENLIEVSTKLKAYYTQQGFPKATVDIKTDELSPTAVKLNIVVSEGPQSTINDIDFISPNIALNRNLKSAVKKFQKRALTESEMQKLTQLLRKYLLENHYCQADLKEVGRATNPEDLTTNIRYEISRPDKYELEIKSLRFGSYSGLIDALNFDEFASTNPNIAGELFTKGKNYFLQNGYSRVDGRYDLINSAQPFFKKIILTYDEGPRIGIEEVQIQGKYDRPEKYYLKLFESKSAKLIADGYFNKDDFDSTTKAFVLELQNQGYLRAKVISTRTQFNKNKDKVTLQINLEEGLQTKIQQIKITGLTAFPEQQIKRLLGIGESQPLILSDLEGGIQKLKSLYFENGFIEFEINEKDDLVTYDDSNTQATINVKLTEGPKVFAERVILEGNTFTNDKVIMNELDVRAGQIITPTKIEESISRLQRTGFFGTVEIKVLDQKTEKTQRTVVVTVSERDPGVFLIGAGATNERRLTLRGYTSIGYRNLYGTGRGISLRFEGNYNIADLKYFENKLILGYIEPSLFDTRLKGRANVTRSKLVTSYSLRQVTETNSYTYSVEKDFSAHVIGIYDLLSLSFFRDTGLDSTYTLPTTDQTIATTGPTLDIDYRDNPFYPTKGFSFRTSAEYSAPGLGSDKGIEFYKLVSTYSKYSPLMPFRGGTLVWANQLRLGYLKNLAPDGGVPWDKKGFILGGQSDLRGYQAGTNDVFPSAVDLNGQDKYVLTTASELALIKTEFRIPLYGSFAMALFYDGGYVNIEGLKFNDNYRDSAGFGFRYVTPIGPISLEFAAKLDRKYDQATNINEDPWRFHLSVGSF